MTHKFVSDRFTKKRTMDLLKSTFPIITWAPSYNGEKAIRDLIAGLTVGLTVIPQGLAYAVLAGLPTQYGLYSSFMGVFIYRKGHFQLRV